MLRHFLTAGLLVVALSCTAKGGQPSNHCCRGKVCSYLFGGYGPGPFGKGNFCYAGYCPYDNRTLLGCKLW
jgi:hypothetical protein